MYLVWVPMSSQEMIKLIKSDGWVRVATKGSHQPFTHRFKPGRVTVPHPKKSLPVGTERSIRRQAGL